ncbi:hypothetical protein CBS101457_003959 [Exobasidium rhododendri]|nr:hypothetical protein CBS101457_003959 [Exobasidium rhododendri]
MVSSLTKQSLIYQVQVANLCHNESVKLPTFCIEDLLWLLQPTLDGEVAGDGPISIGVSLSIQGDAVPDVLALSHRNRLVLLQMSNVEEGELSDHHRHHPGLNLLGDLLLCTSSDAAESFTSFHHTRLEGKQIQLASPNASEVAYLLYHALEVHSCFLDLDLLAPSMGSARHPPFQPNQLIRMALGADALPILNLEAHHFQVRKANVLLDNTFVSSLLGCIRIAIGAYEVACLFTRSCQQAHGHKKLEDGKLDTRLIPSNLIMYMARFEKVEHALKLRKPKVSQARLRMKEDAKDGGIHFSVSKKGNSVDVFNEQFKSKLAVSTQQLLSISLTDKNGHSQTYSAKTIASSGKTSTLNFVGKDEGIALDKLRAGATATMKGAFQSTRVDSVEVRGREDYTASEVEGMRWRRQIMCQQETEEGEAGGEGNYDRSQLLRPFLLGEKPRCIEGVVDKKTIKLMKRPKAHDYVVIKKREARGTLNASQSRAAQAILSPLLSGQVTVDDRTRGDRVKAKEENRWQQEDRLIIVHGPPGTGKTSLITACCEQWEYSCAKVEGGGEELARDSIYACCQSNVAVKNIAESFSKASVNFKIIVSPNFYVEWHEDLYADIQSRLIRTDQLPVVPGKLQQLLKDCDVILCTLAFLSSPKVTRGDCPLFRLRPMRLLFVDEASQIHLRAYPHLLHRFGKEVARVVFLGDDRQLPPFQGDEVVDAGLSVFELPHLRTKAFLLDTCYRLAKPVAEFISENVYDGLLHVGSKNYDPGSLLDCVSFIDVTDWQEEKQGSSRMNRGETQMVVKLMEQYKKRGGSLSRIKVLTTYNAQRDALEEALKRVDLSGASDTVFSVDSFQGRESDFIILSLVKDGKPTIRESRNKNKSREVAALVQYLQPGLGFLSNDRRINVALTRAKQGIIVVSNRKFILETAAETLVGRLQVDLQWESQDGEEHWYSVADVLNNRLPRALFGVLQ